MLIHDPEISRLAAYGVKALPISQTELRRFNDALYSTDQESKLPAFARNRLNEIRQEITNEQETLAQ